MKFRSLIAAGCVLAALGRKGTAQRQTGAPAGIAAPSIPSSVDTSHVETEGAQALHFRIRVVDGRMGSPVPNAHIRLWYDEPAGTGYQLVTDAEGFGNMPAPVGEPLRVLATVDDPMDCRRVLRGDPPKAYNLQGIATTGTAAQNGCGRVAVHATPGQLVLFVRPSRWYEGINRNAGN